MWENHRGRDRRHALYRGGRRRCGRGRLRSLARCRRIAATRSNPAHRSPISRRQQRGRRFKVGYGDVASAFRDAAHVFKEALWHAPRLRSFAGAAARRARYRPRRDGRLTVWSSTQTPHLAKRSLADMLERDPETHPRDRARCRRRLRPEGDFLCRGGRRRAGGAASRPPGEMDRGPARALPLDDAGARSVLGGRDRARCGRASSSACAARMLHDTGAYLPWGVVLPFIAATTVPGPYVLPAYELNVTVAYTNKVPTTPVRGAGRPQAVFAMERLLGPRRARTCARSGRNPPPQSDPARADAVSRRPHVPRRQARHLRQRRLSRDAREGARAVALRRFSAPAARGACSKAAISASASANYVEGTGLGPFEGVTVRVQENGKVLVKSGAAPHGQGHKTMFAADRRRCSSACRIDDIDRGARRYRCHSHGRRHVRQPHHRQRGARRTDRLAERARADFEAGGARA